MTRACPRVHGLMSMNAIVCSSSWTISEGISPAAILQKMQSSGMAAQPTGLQPAGPLEAPVEEAADAGHQEQHGRVAERPAQLRHVVEVHAVDAGDRGR